MAGSDPKALEAVSRYKTEGDLLKAFMEQRTALSKRAEPVRLPENATAEQVAEYRKGLGVPEIAADAKPDAYLDAYKIKAPEGYAISEMEKGLLSEYAKNAYEKGYSPREVKESVDFFFKQQAAQTQMANRVAVEKQREWQNSLRDEMGSKEYDAQQAAGEAWLKEQFRENPDDLANLLNAQLPGGGVLGDHPWFFKQVTQAAMGAGYTDRIEANALESGGKSLAAQQSELEGLRRTNRALYNQPATQDKLMSIIKARVSRGEIDANGNEVPAHQRRRA